MLTSIENAVVAFLRERDIPAVRMYPAAELDSRRPVAAVAVRNAVVTASGLGDYIGIAEDDGSIRELYGSKAELKLAVRTYSPPIVNRTGSLSLMETVLEALRSGSIRIRSTEISGESFDAESGMFVCDALLEIGALLVRERRERTLGDPELGGEDA